MERAEDWRSQAECRKLDMGWRGCAEGDGGPCRISKAEWESSGLMGAKLFKLDGVRCGHADVWEQDGDWRCLAEHWGSVRPGRTLVAKWGPGRALTKMNQTSQRKGWEPKGVSEAILCWS